MQATTVTNLFFGAYRQCAETDPLFIGFAAKVCPSDTVELAERILAQNSSLAEHPTQG